MAVHHSDRLRTLRTGLGSVYSERGHNFRGREVK